MISQIGPERYRWLATAVAQQLDVPNPVLKLTTGQGFLVSRYQSSVLVMEPPGVELICSNARPSLGIRSGSCECQIGKKVLEKG